MLVASEIIADLKIPPHATTNDTDLVYILLNSDLTGDCGGRGRGGGGGGGNDTGGEELLFKFKSKSNWTRLYLDAEQNRHGQHQNKSIEHSRRLIGTKHGASSELYLIQVDSTSRLTNEHLIKVIYDFKKKSLHALTRISIYRRRINSRFIFQ
jgi:hypothetical protein